MGEISEMDLLTEGLDNFILMVRFLYLCLPDLHCISAAVYLVCKFVRM